MSTTTLVTRLRAETYVDCRGGEVRVRTRYPRSEGGDYVTSMYLNAAELDLMIATLHKARAILGMEDEATAHSR